MLRLLAIVLATVVPESGTWTPSPGFPAGPNSPTGVILTNTFVHSPNWGVVAVRGAGKITVPNGYSDPDGVLGRLTVAVDAISGGSQEEDAELQIMVGQTKRLPFAAFIETNAVHPPRPGAGGVSGHVFLSCRPWADRGKESAEIYITGMIGTKWLE